MNDQSKPVALVTGSSSGIGAATARLLGGQGWRVVVNSSRSVEAGRAVADSIGEATYVQADVSEESECRRLIDETVSAYGRLDVLVNNVAKTEIIPHGDLDAVSDEFFLDVLRVNVLSPWHMTRLALPHLRSGGEGVVVNVSSLAGIRAGGSSIPYAVSKAALNHLTLLMANVAGPEVRVNAVAPGVIATPWTQGWDTLKERLAAATPLKRVGAAQDVAEAILGAVRSRYMTGQVVVVDGGRSLR